MHHALLGLLLTGLISPLCTASPLQGDPLTPGSREGIDARVFVAIGEPLFIQIERSLEGEMTVRGAPAPIITEMKEERRFVDRVDVLTDDREECSRQYLRVRSTQDGEITDEPLNGLTLSWISAEGEVQVMPSEGRVLLESKLRKLLRAQGSVGLHASLPRDIAVGESTTIDLSALGDVLLDSYLDTTTGAGSLTLERLEEDGRLAVFTGSLHFIQEGELQPELTGRVEYTLGCELRVDLTEHRIKSINLAGRVEMTAGGTPDQPTLSFDGRYQLELSTASGDSAQRALKEKPVYRKKAFRGTHMDVEVELPSFYDDAANEAGVLYARRCLDGDGVLVSLVYDADLTAKSKADARKVFDGIEVGLERGGVEALRVRKRSGRVGNGRSYAYEYKGKRYLKDVYHHGRRFLVFEVSAPPETFEAARRDMERARSSLRAVRS